MWGRFFVRKELDLQEVWGQGIRHGEKFSFEVSGQRADGGSSDGGKLAGGWGADCYSLLASAEGGRNGRLWGQDHQVSF